MLSSCNLKAVSRTLCSLGAHLGHVKVDAYQSLSYYILGGRSFFVIIDLDKTVPMLKSALLFFENLVLHYGHAVFCHSSIVKFCSHLKYYLARIVNACNQSFSYWRWVPGCITNYRYVFLRLVNLFFSDVRSHDNINNLNIRLSQLYNSSFFSYYRKLWFIFLTKSNFSLRSLQSYNSASIKRQFNFFFFRFKKPVLNKYLSDVFDRDIMHSISSDDSTVFNVKQLHFDASQTKMLELQHAKLEDIGNTKFLRNKYRVLSFLTLPSFISLLFRVCYLFHKRSIKIRFDHPDVSIDEEVLFRFLFKRVHVFWRAIIFFRCFIKTTLLPDCLVLFNPDNSFSECNDFIGVNLPIICLADSTTDISMITYPIPSNDDSIILFLFYFFLFLNACDRAHMNRFLYSL